MTEFWSKTMIHLSFVFFNISCMIKTNFSCILFLRRNYVLAWIVLTSHIKRFSYVNLAVKTLNSIVRQWPGIFLVQNTTHCVLPLSAMSQATLQLQVSFKANNRCMPSLDIIENIICLLHKMCYLIFEWFRIIVLSIVINTQGKILRRKFNVSFCQLFVKCMML